MLRILYYEISAKKGMGLYYVMGVYYALYGTCITVREHLGDYQLMCHTPVACSCLQALGVPDTQRIQLIGSHTTSGSGCGCRCGLGTRGARKSAPETSLVQRL